MEGMTRFNELTSIVAMYQRTPQAQGVVQKLREKAETAGKSKWRKRNRTEEEYNETETRPMLYQLPPDTLELLVKLEDPSNPMEMTGV